MAPVDKSLAQLTADDVMSRDLLLLADDTPLREAAHLLIRNQVSGAPVVDRRGRLVGVLSSLDFVRQAQDQPANEGIANPLACKFQMRRPGLGDEVDCTLPLGSCAIQQVQRDDAGRAWLTCSHPHEMFVDWQVVEVESLSTDAVGRFMTHDVVTASRFTPVGELARQMVDAHIHRIVVTDEDHTPVGIVTSTDILGAVARSAEVAVAGSPA